MDLSTAEILGQITLPLVPLGNRIKAVLDSSVETLSTYWEASITLNG
jgi:hypothetical protein